MNFLTMIFLCIVFGGILLAITKRPSVEKFDKIINDQRLAFQSDALNAQYQLQSILDNKIHEAIGYIREQGMKACDQAFLPISRSFTDAVEKANKSLSLANESTAETRRLQRLVEEFSQNLRSLVSEERQSRSAAERAEKALLVGRKEAVEFHREVNDDLKSVHIQIEQLNADLERYHLALLKEAEMIRELQQTRSVSGGPVQPKAPPKSPPVKPISTPTVVGGIVGS